MPFVAGALYFNPPIAFISLIPAYVVGKYFSSLSHTWPFVIANLSVILISVCKEGTVVVSLPGSIQSTLYFKNGTPVSASVNLPLHHKVQKFSSGTGSPGWSRKKGRKTVVVWLWCYIFK